MHAPDAQLPLQAVQQPGPTKVRRGSWHPKQRATAFENSLEKYKRRRYDRLAFFLSWSAAQRHRCQRSAELNPRRLCRCASNREPVEMGCRLRSG